MHPSLPLTSSHPKVQPIRPTSELTIQLTPFDRRDYRELIAARDQTIRRTVLKLKPALGLAKAVDVGCAVGFFSQTLAECGLSVCGFDARAENIDEARRRFPGISFEVADIENPLISRLGPFDLTLCFGLLYHLENPLQAIRNLRSLTKKGLLLESMCLPDGRCTLLLRQEPRRDDQSLAQIACYPSEAGLVRMLYRAGFAKVYRVMLLPDHEDFRETREHAQRRTVLLASLLPVDLAGFRLLPEPQETEDPWAKSPPTKVALPQRVARFLASPARKKYATLANRARRVFPNLPIPFRLPFGAWWLVEDGAVDSALLYGQFEKMEMEFVEKLLRCGMTVVDAGAHHGFYTLLASKCVGRSGRVVAIEPSPRERARLQSHLRLNRCSNVNLVACAAGDDPGETDLHIVDGFEDGFNSLRPPAIDAPTQAVKVQVRRLDDILSALDIESIDFLKLDVEGAELSALYGALMLLSRKNRPAMLVEVQDVRTRQWGYAAREILQFLMRMDYQWFAIATKGVLLPVNCEQESYDANLVALPAERTKEFLGLLGQA
jgi:FkbM family methyltransferase